VLDENNEEMHGKRTSAKARPSSMQAQRQHRNTIDAHSSTRTRRATSTTQPSDQIITNGIASLHTRHATLHEPHEPHEPHETHTIP
jgi:hypothetical protein